MKIFFSPDRSLTRPLVPACPTPTPTGTGQEPPLAPLSQAHLLLSRKLAGAGASSLAAWPEPVGGYGRRCAALLGSASLDDP